MEIIRDSFPFPTTFKVSNVKPRRFSSRDVKVTNSSICSQLNLYGKNHCTEVLTETQFASNVRASRNNGFVNTVIECYNNHHNLVIRPDDVWTAILTQFSFYINANTEKFRGQFVNFEGKKELVVTMDATLRSAPYDLFVTLLTEKIHENLVDETVKNWVLPNFTTTTPNDTVSCGILLMATTEKYSNLTWRPSCGIPYLTLEGSVNDWENILIRLEKLKSYELDKWYDMLQPILTEFVAAKKKRPNIDFWNRICHFSGGGSGPTYISGWLAAFAVFNEEGKWCGERHVDEYGMEMDWSSDASSDEGHMQPNFDDTMWPKIAEIPPGIVTVDVKIIDLSCNPSVEYESLMFAGHVAYEVLEDKCTLKPFIGWGMALKSTAEEIEKIHEDARVEQKYFCESCDVELLEYEHSTDQKTNCGIENI